MYAQYYLKGIHILPSYKYPKVRGGGWNADLLVAKGLVNRICFSRDISITNVWLFMMKFYNNFEKRMRGYTQEKALIW